jgi:putative transposase
MIQSLPSGSRQSVSNHLTTDIRNLFVPPRSRRSALATHLHRLNAVAQWKAVAGIAA